MNTTCKSVEASSYDSQRKMLIWESTKILFIGVWWEADMKKSKKKSNKSFFYCQTRPNLEAHIANNVYIFVAET